MNTKRKLFIIGNGFDLYHDLRSSYRDFRDYLTSESRIDLVEFFDSHFNIMDLPAEYTKIHEGLEDQPNSVAFGKKLASNFGKILSLDTWSFLEASLGCLGGVNDGDEYETVTFSTDIRDLFNKWLSDKIAGCVSDVKQKLKLSPEDLYLNFNYTAILEQIYNISESNVCHIHGKIGEGVEFGHINYQAMQESLQTIDPPQVDQNVLNLIPDAQKILNAQAAKLNSNHFLHDYYKNTLKDVKKIETAHSQFWDSLLDIDEVYVLGHSLGFVDQVYFQKIKEKLPNATWIISYHNEKAKSDIMSRNIYKSLPENKIKLRKWEDIKELLDESNC